MRDEAMINELEFFNQATLRICSSLDISEVAQECLDFLEDYIVDPEEPDFFKRARG